MPHRIKSLLIGFASVATLGAILASAAEAGSLNIGTPVSVVTGQILASQQHNLTVPLAGGGNLPAKCTSATFEGTTQGFADLTEATVTPTYGPGCKISGQAAHVRMNGCKYTVTGSGQPAGTALVDVIGCTAGKQIEIEQTATGCIIALKEQNGLSHVVFENSATEPKDVVVSATITNVTATPNANCPGAGVQVTTATFSGSTTVRAFEANGVKQVTLHGHQYEEHICGGQLDLVST